MSHVVRFDVWWGLCWPTVTSWRLFFFFFLSQHGCLVFKQLMLCFASPTLKLSLVSAVHGSVVSAGIRFGLCRNEARTVAYKRQTLYGLLMESERMYDTLLYCIGLFSVCANLICPTV